MVFSVSLKKAADADAQAIAFWRFIGISALPETDYTFISSSREEKMKGAETKLRPDA